MDTLLLNDACVCADYENYYPKDAKKGPKNEHKSESRGSILFLLDAIQHALFVLLSDYHRMLMFF